RPVAAAEAERLDDLLDAGGLPAGVEVLDLHVGALRLVVGEKLVDLVVDRVVRLEEHRRRDVRLQARQNLLGLVRERVDLRSGPVPALEAPAGDRVDQHERAEHGEDGDRGVASREELLSIEGHAIAPSWRRACAPTGTGRSQWRSRSRRWRGYPRD